MQVSFTNINKSYINSSLLMWWVMKWIFGTETVFFLLQTSLPTYDFKYSYLILIIRTQLSSFKYSNMILKIYTWLYCFKYLYQISIICTLLYGIKYPYHDIDFLHKLFQGFLSDINDFSQLYGFTYSYLILRIYTLNSLSWYRDLWSVFLATRYFFYYKPVALHKDGSLFTC